LHALFLEQEQTQSS